MPRIRIDNREIEVEAGSTVLQAARKLGIDIPALCYLEGCKPNTSCLACVVRINGSPRLMPSCATKVVEGMIIESETPDVRESRRTALELLLADHAGDCLAPCTNVCPAHMDIPLMIRHIQEGRLHLALVTVKQAIALPAILGRICPELCEKGCRRGAMDSPVSICQLKRHVADVDLASGNPYIPPCRESTGKRVAIVGSGPTGLAAAYYLLQAGHHPIILDEHPEPGGNLRYAIEEDKLPRNVIDAEIGIIRTMGAEFRQNVQLGQHVSVQELRQECDAVLLAIGEVCPAKATSLGLELAGKGLKADRHTMMTPIEMVFAAGAAVTPFRHAVRGVAEGRNAAEIIDQYLHGLRPASEGPAFTIRLGVLNEAELATFTANANPVHRVPANLNGQSLSIPDAKQESNRCLHCDCGKLNGCRLRDYSIAYGASPKKYAMDRKPFERVVTHADIVHEPGKCIACGLCVQIAEQAKEPLGLAFVGRGFKVRIGTPFNQAMSDALRKVAQECAKACPTGALVLRDSINLQPHPSSAPDSSSNK